MKGLLNGLKGGDEKVLNDSGSTLTGDEVVKKADGKVFKGAKKALKTIENRKRATEKN